jgi:hypothetical protein
MEVFLEVPGFLGALGALLAGVAAYFSWKQYSRRPKLKFYPQESPDGKSPEIIYDDERGTADVVGLLANEGAVTAHNVYGWLQYCEVSGRAWPIEDEYSDVEDKHSDVIHVADEYATVYVERIMPNPPHEAASRFLDSPKLFGFPVKVYKAGVVELRYRFLCDEGAKTKGTLRLHFPDVTPL